MALPLKPTRGGFLRSFGCGWFIREFLLGNGPYESTIIDPQIGAPQADIFHEYKTALMKATALDKSTRAEEKLARREKRRINPENIVVFTSRYLAAMPYKSHGCRYHSFVVYFSTLRRLNWVEPSGYEELSSFQGNYPSGQPRRYYRLTVLGKTAGNASWSNPQLALYG